MTPQTTGSRFRIVVTCLVLASGLVAPLSAIASAASTHQASHTAADGKKKLKPVCHLVTDPTEDAKTAAGVNDPSLDIVSADVATNKKSLTAVIRVAKLTVGSDSQSPFGRYWDFKMAVPGASAGQLVVAVSDGPFGVRDADGLGGKVRLDPATNSIYVTESLKVLAGAFHAHIVFGKTRLTQFAASSAAQIQEPAVEGLAALGDPSGAKDSAPSAGVSPAVYIAGRPSCLKVGS